MSQLQKAYFNIDFYTFQRIKCPTSLWLVAAVTIQIFWRESAHMLSLFFGNERPEARKRRKKRIGFVNFKALQMGTDQTIEDMLAQFKMESFEKRLFSNLFWLEKLSHPRLTRDGVGIKSHQKTKIPGSLIFVPQKAIKPLRQNASNCFISIEKYQALVVSSLGLNFCKFFGRCTEYETVTWATLKRFTLDCRSKPAV